MPKTINLASALSSVVPAEKRANALTHDRDQIITQSLQDIVGEDRSPVSAFGQTSPDLGHGLLANPLSPLQGDEIFWTYCMSGAIFQSHDGQVWEIQSYAGEGTVEVMNLWYVRQRGFVSIQDLRKSIYAWIDPVQLRVPPPPAGVDYGTLDVRVVQ
jgi:hypothetical protein